jgi:hypothetical protein
MRISSCVLLCLLSASLVSSIPVADVPRHGGAFNVSEDLQFTHGDVNAHENHTADNVFHPEVVVVVGASERKLLRHVARAPRPSLRPSLRPGLRRHLS